MMMLGLFQTAFAQAPAAIPDTSKMTYNQLSSGLKLYVFPAKGQSQQQQKTDEFECYKWAVQQSGIDPLNLPKIEAAPQQSGPTGGMVVGGAKGAAAGVAIGAIAGDAGKGAAIGAVAEAVSGQAAAAGIDATTELFQLPSRAPAIETEAYKIDRLFQTGDFWLILTGFFGVGLLRAFTPCVFPMFPILRRNQ